VVISATALPASLGRVVQHRRVIVAIDDSSTAHITLTWRPPLFAQPLAMGTLANDALPSALRDALATGDDPGSARLLIVLLLVLVCVIVVVGVPRLWWAEARASDDDEARELLAARALLSTIELEEWRGRAPKESAPRRRDDSTSRASNSRQP